MNYWCTQLLGWISKTSCWGKEARPNKSIYRMILFILNLWIGKMNHWWQKAELWSPRTRSQGWLQRICGKFWKSWKYFTYYITQYWLWWYLHRCIHWSKLRRTHFKWIHFIMYILSTSINFNFKQSRGQSSNKNSSNHYNAPTYLVTPM